jgi:hypothetical protein
MTPKLRAILAVSALALTLGGCGMSRRLHVTYGESPHYVDQDVRFRTTYYFRVFDYCALTKATIGGEQYAKVIPNTEALYRYRMTGKASAMFTKIRFESGVLKAAQIDPWGAKIGFQEDGKAEYTAAPAGVDADTAQDSDYTRISQLMSLLKGMSAAEFAASRGVVENALSRLIQARLGLTAADNETIVKNVLEGYKKDRDAAQAKFDMAQKKAIADREDATKKRQTAKQSGTTDDDNIAKTAEETAEASEASATSAQKDKENVDLKGGVAASEALAAIMAASVTDCPPNLQRKRGFQVMGPEGMKTFNPEDRLVMAVSFDGKPLVEMLQQYAARVLAPKAGLAARTLPLVQENLVLADARAAAAAAKPAPRGDAKAKDAAPILAAALAKLAPVEAAAADAAAVARKEAEEAELAVEASAVDAEKWQADAEEALKDANEAKTKDDLAKAQKRAVAAANYAKTAAATARVKNATNPKGDAAKKDAMVARAEDARDKAIDAAKAAAKATGKIPPAE